MTINEINDKLLPFKYENLIGQLQIQLDSGKDIDADIPIFIAIPPSNLVGKVAHYINLKINYVNKLYVSKYKFCVNWQLHQVNKGSGKEEYDMASVGQTTTFINENNLTKIIRGIVLKIRDIAIYHRKQFDGNLPGINGRSLDIADSIIPYWEYATNIHIIMNPIKFEE